MAFLSSTFQTHRLPSIRSLPELAKHLPPSPPPLNNSSADEDTDRSWAAAVKESTTEEADVDEDKILIKPKSKRGSKFRFQRNAALSAAVATSKRPPLHRSPPTYPLRSSQDRQITVPFTRRPTLHHTYSQPQHVDQLDQLPSPPPHFSSVPDTTTNYSSSPSFPPSSASSFVSRFPTPPRSDGSSSVSPPASSASFPRQFQAGSSWTSASSWRVGLPVPTTSLERASFPASASRTYATWAKECS
ncbi:hypothetical protein JCM1841_006363 [Sporobolomyces salmonicolor]